MRRPPTLYVHAPFCRAKCRYCAFYSLPAGADGPGAAELSRYIAALEAEMDAQRETWAQALSLGPAPSVFLGGGTPSLLGAEGLDRVLSALRRRFPLAEDAEITIEANPDSATPAFLAAARRLGVNRLSLGVQSLDDALLARLGRPHDAAQAVAAVAAARAAGFTNLGLDLIFGLPGQSVEAWLGTLRQALELAPEHLSCYGLTIEPGTPLARDAAMLAALPDDDAQAEMYLRGAELLAAAGFAHYEISNFALPGRRCRHNALCWQGGDVLGFGPAAVSTVSLGAGRALRWANPQSLDRWEALVRSGRAGSHGREELGPELRAREALMLALRTADGLDLDEHEKRCGHDLRRIRHGLIKQLTENGLATLAGGRLALSDQGMLLSNSIIRALGFDPETDD